MSDLSAVRDLDSVVSFSPLALDLTSREVTGASAVLRRVLYVWLPYLDGVDGATLAPEDVDGLRQALERVAGDEDFVLSIAVRVSLVDNTLTILGKVTLVDGRTYPLEVAASAAGLAIQSLGGATS